MPLSVVEETIIQAVDQVGPSVVTVATTQVARDAWLRPFPVEGMGSGVIVSDDGLIVTNHHVVRGARTAEVRLPDGRRERATYVGGDPTSDLALLRIDASGLSPAKLGDSDALRVGQFAIAIGSPFGQLLNGPTVTVGVVSALHRTLQSDRGVIDDVIQTDAPINPGNSGGALLDSSGRVIGINTAIISQAQGIGFAIPINHVKHVVEQVLRHGRVVRSWIGIQGVTLDTSTAGRLNIPEEEGVLVLGVVPGGPADRAGLREGDVVTHVGDQALSKMEALRVVLDRSAPGRSIELRIRRRGGGRKVTVDLEERLEVAR